VHSRATVAEALRLRSAGFNNCEISRRIGIPRSTIRDWSVGKQRCSGAHPSPVIHNSGAYLYLLGLYLGDGCISAHSRGVYRLRITLDARYPAIVEECEAALRGVLPLNRVGRHLRQCNCYEVSAYSKSWPHLFPQHGRGKKHERRIVLAVWRQELVDHSPGLLLRGLIHSDGCRFVNTGRGNWRCPRYSFSNLSADIKQIFCDTCDRLDIHWTAAPPKTIYVSRKADVARLDEFIGPKR
jgi:Homeodomain-like domain-containing protein